MVLAIVLALSGARVEAILNLSVVTTFAIIAEGRSELILEAHRAGEMRDWTTQPGIVLIVVVCGVVGVRLLIRYSSHRLISY